jgi:hypothetical protein
MVSNFKLRLCLCEKEMSSELSKRDKDVKRKISKEKICVWKRKKRKKRKEKRKRKKRRKRKEENGKKDMKRISQVKGK